MTSGHDQQGNHQGQPPPWQQPGPPPYGQQPYGQQPYGYAPMPPPGYGQPPPEPKERPLTVRAGLGAFVGSIVLSVAGSLFALANWDEYVARSIAAQPQFQDPQFQDTGVDPAALVEGLSTLFFVVSLVFAALHLLFVWFAWRGHNWARIVLFVLGGLGIAGGVFSLASIGSSPFPSLTALSVFGFLAVLVGVVLLARRPSSEWYASEKWRRSLTP